MADEMTRDVTSPAYMDASLPAIERAKLLLAELSPEEKMAQLAGVFSIRGYEQRMAAFFKNGIGEISGLGFRMCETAADAAAWQVQLQKLVMDNSAHHIPAIFHMEGVNGTLIQDTTPFPSGVNRGASFDPDLEEEIGRIVARQELAFGFTHILAPVLDVARDPRMGRHSEAYGEDPTLAAALGARFTKGIQETEAGGRRPQAVAKHFLGFHMGQGGIHGAHIDTGDRLLAEVYGKPFQAAITESGLKGVMPCYGSIDGLPIHASRKYLKGLLRDEMGFEGLLFSDYGGITNVCEVQQVTESNADAGLKCMEAGMDLELPMPKGYSSELLQRFVNGEADMAMLDEHVLRVLTAKFEMGLFEHPFALEGEDLEKVLYRAEDEEITRRAARQSLILLKNDGVLPLAKGIRRIALIGPQAVNARYQFGGYTHLSMVEAQMAAASSMAGVGAGGSTKDIEMVRVPGTNVQDDESDVFYQVLQRLEPNCKNLKEALTELLPDTEIVWARGYYKAGADESGFAEALQLIESADLAILTLGGKNGSGSIATMAEGVDSMDINLPAGQDAFIRAASKLGKPLVGVHFDGRPISSDTADECLSAILEAFTPARYGAVAAAEVLTGACVPSGKLPVSVARNAGQVPVYYDHPNGSAWHQGPSIGFTDYVDGPHRPRYPFGFGLSYTEFAYADAALSAEKTHPDESVDFAFTLTNTGDVEGTEIVQLYAQDVKASMTRPCMELVGFARVTLSAGESKRVTFTYDPALSAFLDEEMRWKVEKGEIKLMIGASSEDIRLEASLEVTGDRFLVGRERPFRAKVSLS